MIPWLSEGKLTSSFFAEDIEVGMVAWGHKLFRSAGQFLGRYLNLCLMDPFQGILLRLFVKSCETLGSVLEHVTRSGAAGKLHYPLFSIYHRVMLLQPHVPKDKQVLSKA